MGKNCTTVRRLSNKTNSRVEVGGDRYGDHRAGDATDPQPENSLGDLASGASARSDAPDGADGGAGVADSGSQPEPNTPHGSQNVSNASNPHSGAITPEAPQNSVSGSHSGQNGDEIATLDQLQAEHARATRCPQHAQWPADKPVPNCLACKNVREKHENQHHETQAAARARRRAAQAVCTTCDDDGLIARPGRRYATCDHPTVTRGDVADYLQKQPPKVHSQPDPPKRKLAPMPIEKYPAHAREKPCPECEQPAGQPCKFPDGYQPPAPCTARILNLQPVKETQ